MLWMAVALSFGMLGVIANKKRDKSKNQIGITRSSVMGSAMSESPTEFVHLRKNSSSFLSFDQSLESFNCIHRDVPMISVSIMDSLMRHLIYCLQEKSEDSILKLLTWAQDEFGFEAAILMRLSSQKDLIEIPYFINHSYNELFVKQYFKEKLSNIDPIIRFSSSKCCTFEWNQVVFNSHIEETKKYFQFLENFGLHDGIASVFWDQGESRKSGTLLCIANTQKCKSSIFYVSELIMPVLKEIVNMLHIKNSAKMLTGREMEILRWAKEGKTVWEIGAINSLAESTIKFHLQNIYRKLEVSNRILAVSRALQLEIIDW